MWLISLPLILSTFGIIFIAELPDKTALAALVLAAKFKPRDVILGAWLAFVIQTIIAVVAGSFLTLLPKQPIHIASGLGFLVFAVLAFRRKEDEAAAEETEAVNRERGRHSAWITSFFVIFAAEWGDLTQLATAALVAQNGHALSIAIGATAALWAVTVLAAISGAHLNRVLSPERLNLLSGVLFAALGAVIIVSAFLGK
jgi:putative Ca2+/H+ antiporter (TMEM165/GDT1 family)